MMRPARLAVLVALAVGASLPACRSATRREPPRRDAEARAHTPSPASPATPDTPPAPDTPAPPAAAPPAPPAPAADDAAWREVFPHVRVHIARREVEFDGVVPIDPHNPQTPRIFLEALACTADTKEHESLVMTRARPSHVHAALLLVGLQPGAPGRWDWTGDTIRAIPPTGPRVRVEVHVARDGRDVAEPLASWAVSARTGESLVSHDAGHGLVFAGSQMITRAGDSVYRADAEGCIVGLTTFGGETIAWTAMHHHDTAVEDPAWIADPARLPPFGSPVRVRITPAD
ncbi:MAG: YdjY domain-containing protein [Planctomycetota bacterium]|nr:YdjY domain-containing protein [Planctomycetota bacterium]